MAITSVSTVEPGLETLLVGRIGATVEFGTVATPAAAGSNTLQAKDKRWATDIFPNLTVVVDGGAGMGQARRIARNAQDVLVIEGTWALALDTTTTFRIVLGQDAVELGEREHTSATDGSVNVGVASTLVLAANPSRRYALIVNVSPVWVYLAKGAAAVVGQGIPLAPGGLGVYEIDWTTLYRGAINGIHAGVGNQPVTVEEGT